MTQCFRPSASYTIRHGVGGGSTILNGERFQRWFASIMLLRSPLISPGAVQPFHKNMLNHFATDMDLSSRMYGGNSLFYQHPYRAVLEEDYAQFSTGERH